MTRRDWPDLLEKIYAVIALALFSGALLPLLRPETNAVAGDPTAQATWMVVYAIAGLLMLRRPEAVWRTIKRDPLMALLTAIGLASVFWSYAPDVTLRKIVGLFGTTLFGVYLASRFSFKELIEILTWTVAVAVVGSLALAVAVPGMGLDVGSYAGALRGLYSQKNMAGRMMVFCILIFGLRLWDAHHEGQKAPRWWWAGLGLAGVALLWTTSKTALVSMILLGGFLAATPLLRSGASMLLGLGFSGLLLGPLVGAVVSKNAETLTAILGRDLTLTGRVQIWQACIELLQARYWQGYGFEAFWLGADADSGYVWRALDYEAPFSHNGFVEVWLNVGMAGLVVLVLHLLLTLGLAVWRMRREEGVLTSFFPLIMAFSLFFNITEASLLKANNLFWVLYIVAAYHLFTGLRARPAARPRLAEPLAPV